MKIVILMRHADSYPANFSGYEKEKSISMTGLLQIEQIVASTHDILKDVDFVLCSGLKRAKQTFQAIYSVVPTKTRFMFDDSLPQISSIGLLDKIQWTPSIYNKILIVGHNPGLSQFLNDIIPGQSNKLSTCELVLLEANVKTWQDISYNHFVVKNRVRPDLEN
ncbi:MAG: hypothetical protein LBS83_01015 [Holosporales bacterium]|jgi:phosphohistidine phosphatase|nr:hypothetical protein [Holosporales bacterium]